MTTQVSRGVACKQPLVGFREGDNRAVLAAINRLNSRANG